MSIKNRANLLKSFTMFVPKIIMHIIIFNYSKLKVFFRMMTHPKYGSNFPDFIGIYSHLKA